MDFEGDMIAGKCELFHRILFDVLLDLEAGENSRQQSESDRDPGQPCFPGWTGFQHRACGNCTGSRWGMFKQTTQKSCKNFYSIIFTLYSDAA